jgi:hypothetical protein
MTLTLPYGVDVLQKNVHYASAPCMHVHRLTAAVTRLGLVDLNESDGIGMCACH